MLSMASCNAEPARSVHRDDERWRLVEELVASPHFSGSPRLSGFLVYICEMTLEGRETELNEHAIGMHVFGRPFSYNPVEDSIVRSQARLLRGRLDLFFQAHSDAEWRLIVPKGSFVPVFERRELTRVGADTVEHETPAPAPLPSRGRGSDALWLVAAGVCILVLLLVGYRFLRGMPAPADRALWSAVFAENRPTIIVPSDNMLPFDLKTAVRVAHLPEAARSQLEVTYPVDLTDTKAREANLILMGGTRANSLVRFFTTQLHFQIEADRVVDTLSRDLKAGSYSFELDSLTPRSFGVIALLPGLSGGQTLLVEGSDGAGAEAASEFLFDAAGFDAFAARMGASRGPLPHFEVLLGTGTMKGNASRFQVVAFHRLP